MKFAGTVCLLLRMDDPPVLRNPVIVPGNRRGRKKSLGNSVAARTYHVQGWLNEIAAAKLSRNTLKHIKSTISGIFTLAARGASLGS
jgi:hypothetical protein